MEMELRKSKMKMPTFLKDKEQKLTKMLLIIFICFLLSYGPGMVFKLVRIKTTQIITYDKIIYNIKLRNIKT